MNHRVSRLALGAAFSCLALCGLAFAETEAESCTVEDLSWMAGHWKGDAFGGVCEEVWTPASCGTMVGTFKLCHNDRVSFYEIMTIIPDSTGLVLHVKHFNADMTGWEHRDSTQIFRYTTHGDQMVQFQGLKYELTSPDGLRIAVTMSHKDGSTSQEFIECVRVREEE